jgi:hypothetical protein
VTGLGEFSPIGRLFTWCSFCENYRRSILIIGLPCFIVKFMYI